MIGKLCVLSALRVPIQGSSNTSMMLGGWAVRSCSRCLRSLWRIFNATTWCWQAKSFAGTTKAIQTMKFVHTEPPFRNLIKLNRNQIVITIFQLICNQTDVCLVLNQSKNGKYNLISVWFNIISLCVRACNGADWN